MGLTRGVTADEARRALISALILFANTTGSSIIAEGVETAEDCESLKALGIRKAQGYFLARPMPAEAVMAFLATRKAA